MLHDHHGNKTRHNFCLTRRENKQTAWAHLVHWLCLICASASKQSPFESSGKEEEKEMEAEEGKCPVAPREKGGVWEFFIPKEYIFFIPENSGSVNEGSFISEELHRVCFSSVPGITAGAVTSDVLKIRDQISRLLWGDRQIPLWEAKGWSWRLSEELGWMSLAPPPRREPNVVNFDWGQIKRQDEPICPSWNWGGMKERGSQKSCLLIYAHFDLTSAFLQKLKGTIDRYYSCCIISIHFSAI